MPVLPRLVEAYTFEGYAVLSGLNPTHYKSFPGVPFTWIIRDGKLASSGLGISVQEVYFFECLLAALPPRPIYVIGNAMGFSTLAIAPCVFCPRMRARARVARYARVCARARGSRASPRHRGVGNATGQDLARRASTDCASRFGGL